MIIKNYKAIFGLILALSEGIIPSSAAEQSVSARPTVVSLCSGYGVTDRVLLDHFQIVASADMDSKRTILNQLNNPDCIEDPSLKYSIVTGDITMSETQYMIHQNTKNKVGQNKEIDLLYCFVAQGKQIDSTAIIKATFNLACMDLQHLPKMLCFELLYKGTDPIWTQALQDTNYITHILPNYHFVEKNFKFSDYGLPISNQRKYKVFVLKNGDNQVGANLQALFPTPSPSKGVREALEDATLENPDLPKDWWSQEDPYIANVPLHAPSGEVSADAKNVLAKLEPDMKISDLKCLSPNLFNQENCNKCLICQFHKEGQTKVTAFAKRFSSEKPLNSINARFNAWYEAVHFQADRPFTPFEIAVLNGLLKIGNFTISTNIENHTSYLISTIVAATSPDFLSQLFSKFYDFLRPNSAFKESPKIPLNLTVLPRFLFTGEVKPANLWIFRAEKQNQELLPFTEMLPTKENYIKTYAWNTLQEDLTCKVATGVVSNSAGTLASLVLGIKGQAKESYASHPHKIEKCIGVLIESVRSYLSIENAILRANLDALLRPEVMKIVARLNEQSHRWNFVQLFSTSVFYKEVESLHNKIEMFTLEMNKSLLQPHFNQHQAATAPSFPCYPMHGPTAKPFPSYPMNRAPMGCLVPNQSGDYIPMFTIPMQGPTIQNFFFTQQVTAPCPAAPLAINAIIIDESMIPEPSPLKRKVQVVVNDEVQGGEIESDDDTTFPDVWETNETLKRYKLEDSSASRR